MPSTASEVVPVGKSLTTFDTGAGWDRTSSSGAVFCNGNKRTIECIRAGLYLQSGRHEDATASAAAASSIRKHLAADEFPFPLFKRRREFDVVHTSLIEGLLNLVPEFCGGGER